MGPTIEGSEGGAREVEPGMRKAGEKDGEGGMAVLDLEREGEAPREEKRAAPEDRPEPEDDLFASEREDLDVLPFDEGGAVPNETPESWRSPTGIVPTGSGGTEL